jgi:integrase
VAYAEKRGNLWRARWHGPDGTLESKRGFTSRTAAEKFGRDQEAAIRANTYVDPRTGRVTVTEWVNRWFPALDLEPSTLANYRYLIEVHILPAFGTRPLASLTSEEISTWEQRIAADGYSPRTGRDAPSMLTTVLGDAIPRYLQVNPAQRKRGKGRKGRRRIERYERAEKAWPTPLEALLIAERCSALSGQDTDFVMLLTIAYTGMRWSEAVGLRPLFVRGDQLGIEWKLYEIKGKYYVGRPKDGSIRTADLPSFLAELLASHLDAHVGRTCTCRKPNPPWCQGASYAFLGPRCGHFRRSDYGARYFRPAADGWYPGRGRRSAMPVLADASCCFPGRPVGPWPATVPGEPFVVPAGRGVRRLASDDRTGRCQDCGRAVRRRLDGLMIAHDADGRRCSGSGQAPADDPSLTSWLPVTAGLTPHGLRHGHQTWMEEAGISDLLRSERMGHEVPGMRGIYAHVTADGWYPPHGKIGRMPVLVNADGAFPRQPLPPWPPAEPGVPFAPPAGRGVTRLASDATTGRCAACRRALHRRLDGSVITHSIDGARCPGSGQQPADDVALASWLPVLRGLTPHGLRHGHQTWMDEDRIAEVLKSERMGHEVPGMHGVYGHVSQGMRDELRAMLQHRWTESLGERAALSPRSSVPALDALLTGFGARSAPKLLPETDTHQRGSVPRQAASGH